MATYRYLLIDVDTGQKYHGPNPASPGVPMVIVDTYEVLAGRGVIFPGTPLVLSGGVLQIDSGAQAVVL